MTDGQAPDPTTLVRSRNDGPYNAGAQRPLS